MNENCKCCRYLGHAGADLVCDYILITGRKRPCPAGAGCEVREEKTKRRTNIVARKAEWDTEMAVRLAEEG